MVLTKARIFIMAAALCAGAVAINNCSRNNPQSTGRVSVAVTTPSGVSIGPVTYTLSPAGSSTAILSGTFNVGSDPSTDGHVFVDLALPAGGPDTLMLTAMSTGIPARTFSGTSLPFNVVAGISVTVLVTLSDTLATQQPGTVQVDGTIVPGNHPPLLTSVVVAPARASIGTPISVAATATDPDGDALTYAWTAPQGSFASPSSAMTTFIDMPVGIGGGRFDLTVTVSDGKSPISVGLPVTILGGECAELSVTPACNSCTVSNCSLGASGTDGCCGLASAADRVLCQAVVTCFADNAATCVSSGDPTDCFCGSSGGQCFMTAGAANGPCTAQVFAAAKTMSPPAIQGQFTSPASPLGRGVNLTACRGAFCNMECMIP